MTEKRAGWSNLSFKERSDIITSWLGVGSVVIGACAFAITYYSDRQQAVTEKQKQVMALYSEYSEKLLPSREVYLALRAQSAKATEPLQKIQGNADAIVERINETKRSTMKTNILEGARGSKIDRLIFFFERVNACVNTNICDEPMTRELFSAEAYDLTDFLLHYVETKQLYQPAFGTGLRNIACRSSNPADC